MNYKKVHEKARLREETDRQAGMGGGMRDTK